MSADPSSAGEASVATTERVRRWWWHLTPQRQDRLAVLAPLAAVLLFLAAIIASFGYLRLEEIDREQEAVKRDVEYSQQRLRLRLLERQEQLMRIARDISNGDLDVDEFHLRAETLVNQYPDLERLSWIDERRRIKGTYATASLQPNLPFDTRRDLAAEVSSLHEHPATWRVSGTGPSRPARCRRRRARPA